MAISTDLEDTMEDPLQRASDWGVPAPTEDTTVPPETFLLGDLPPHVLQAMLDEHPTDPGNIPAIPIRVLTDETDPIASRIRCFIY